MDSDTDTGTRSREEARTRLREYTKNKIDDALYGGIMPTRNEALILETLLLILDGEV